MNGKTCSIGAFPAQRPLREGFLRPPALREEPHFFPFSASFVSSPSLRCNSGSGSARRSASWTGELFAVLLAALFVVVLVVLLAAGCADRSGGTADPQAGRSSAAYPGQGGGQTAAHMEAAAAAEGALWSFAVLGDSRIATEQEFEAAGSRGRGNRVYPELVALAAGLSPSPRALFVLGDLGNKAGRAAHLRLFLFLSRPFRPGCLGASLAGREKEDEGMIPTGCADTVTMATPAGRGNAPCLFALPGNHDVRDAGSLETYLKVIRPPGGKPYFTVDRRGVRFICLDSETVDRSLGYHLLRRNRREAKIEGDQAVWLEGQLQDAADQGLEVIVLLHRPLFPPPFAKNRGDGMDRHPAARDALHRTLVESGVKAVITSHDHMYHRSEKDGIVYFITGGGGAGLYAPEPHGGFHHFLYGLVSPGTLHVYAVDVEGRVADEVVIPW